MKKIFLLILIMVIYCQGSNAEQMNDSKEFLKLIDSGEIEAAIKLGEVLSKKYPGDTGYFETIAGLLESQNRIEEAINYLDKALKIKPSSDSVLMNYGLLFFNLNEFAKAIPYLQKSFDLAGGGADTFKTVYALGIAYYNVNDKEKAMIYLSAFLIKSQQVAVTEEWKPYQENAEKILKLCNHK
jgi:tetratricopeptide (TPR) repeat protein